MLVFLSYSLLAVYNDVVCSCSVCISDDVHVFFFYLYGYLRDLHSFPTRRSSDLAASWLLNRSSDLAASWLLNRSSRSEERFSRNAETDLVCRLLLEKKKNENRDGKRLTQKRREPLLVYFFVH